MCYRFRRINPRKVFLLIREFLKQKKANAHCSLDINVQLNEKFNKHAEEKTFCFGMKGQ